MSAGYRVLVCFCLHLFQMKDHRFQIYKGIQVLKPATVITVRGNMSRARMEKSRQVYQRHSKAVRR